MFEKLVEQSDDHSITEDVLQLMLKSFYLTMEMYVYVYVYTSWGINVCNRCKSTTPSHGPHSQLRIFYSSDHTVQSSVYDVGKLFVIRLTYVLYQWLIYCLFPLTTQSTSVFFFCRKISSQQISVTFGSWDYNQETDQDMLVKTCI